MKIDQLISEKDRKHIERDEARNRAATYFHRNTAQLRPHDYAGSEEWACHCGGLGCSECQLFD